MFHFDGTVHSDCASMLISAWPPEAAGEPNPAHKQMQTQVRRPGNLA
jgi:hypothetical protein